MTRTDDRSRRALRRRSFRQAQESWARFLRTLDNGHPWRPFRWMTADEWHRLVAKLASRSISWRGSDGWWKQYLRKVRKQHEAEDLRIEHEQSTTEEDPVWRRSRCSKGEP